MQRSRRNGARRSPALLQGVPIGGRLPSSLVQIYSLERLARFERLLSAPITAASRCAAGLGYGNKDVRDSPRIQQFRWIDRCSTSAA